MLLLFYRFAHFCLDIGRMSIGIIALHKLAGVIVGMSVETIRRHLIVCNFPETGNDLNQFLEKYLIDLVIAKISCRL